MKPLTHAATSVLVAAIIHKLAPDLKLFDLSIAAAFTANMADLDQKITIKRKGKRWIRHRGQTHSLIWPLSAAVLAGLYYASYTFSLLVGACAGFLAHCLADVLNGKGIEAFWPFSQENYSLMDLEYNGLMENIICVVSIIGFIYLSK